MSLKINNLLLSAMNSQTLQVVNSFNIKTTTVNLGTGFTYDDDYYRWNISSTLLLSSMILLNINLLNDINDIDINFKIIDQYSNVIANTCFMNNTPNYKSNNTQIFYTASQPDCIKNNIQYYLEASKRDISLPNIDTLSNMSISYVSY